MRCQFVFQFHKGTIRTPAPLMFLNVIIYFNSIKVRLEPIEATTEKPIHTVGLRVQRYKKIFRKMSMSKDIFSAALRQPAYLWRFQ